MRLSKLCTPPQILGEVRRRESFSRLPALRVLCFVLLCVALCVSHAMMVSGTGAAIGMRKMNNFYSGGPPKIRSEEGGIPIQGGQNREMHSKA